MPPFRLVALVAGAAGLAVALLAQRAAIVAYPWRGAWLPFALAAVAFAGGPLLGGVAFWLLLRDLTAASALLPSLRTWARSFLARYVPSGALTVAVRVRAREELGATTAQMLSATAYEQLAAALGGAAAATAAFALAGGGQPVAAPVILVAGLALAAVLRPRLLGAAARRLPLVQTPEGLVFVRGRALAAAALASLAAWGVTGTAAWILVSALTPEPPPALVLVGAYALAWLLGFLAVFAPSGLGVREATLVVLLAPHLGAAAATAIAVALRLANVAGDLVAVAGVELAARFAERPWRRRPVGSGA